MHLAASGALGLHLDVARQTDHGSGVRFDSGRKELASNRAFCCKDPHGATPRAVRADQLRNMRKGSVAIRDHANVYRTCCVPPTERTLSALSSS
jgi:hypothetical protein